MQLKELSRDLDSDDEQEYRERLDELEASINIRRDMLEEMKSGGGNNNKSENNLN